MQPLLHTAVSDSNEARLGVRPIRRLWANTIRPYNIKIKLYLITSESAVVFLAWRWQGDQGKLAINHRGITSQILQHFLTAGIPSN